MQVIVTLIRILFKEVIAKKEPLTASHSLFILVDGSNQKCSLANIWSMHNWLSAIQQKLLPVS